MTVQLQLNSNQYDIITPNEKKGLQLLALLSKKDRSPEDIEKIKELTPPGQEYVVHLDVGNRINEPGFFLYHHGIPEAIQRRIQEANKSTTLKEVNNLSQTPYQETISTTIRDLDHMAEELVFLAHSIQVYSPNEMKKKLIQQSKNIQKAVTILNQKFTNQRNA